MTMAPEAPEALREETADGKEFAPVDLDAARPEGDEEVTGDPEVAVRVPLVVLSGALATFSAAWMVTRLFRGGVLAPAVALLGIAIGAGFVYASSRFSSPILQFAAIPAALITGAVLATAAASGGSLPSLVSDALNGGGLLQPPIPFAPGWRFLIVVIFAFVCAGASLLAIATARPKLAVAIPMPIALGAALIQPKGSEILASAVAVVFLVAALAVAYGAVLAADGGMGGGFETRRLVRAAGLLVAVIVGLVALAQTDFLFPATNQDQVIPPMKPPSPPPAPDRELFTVKSERKGPWRVGVLDVYKDNGFLLPSVDPKRVKKVGADGALDRIPGETYSAQFTLTGIKGQVLIVPANPVAIHKLSRKLQFDPRTQLVKLVETAVPKGATYTIEAPVSPDAKTLAESPDPAPQIVREFAEMPRPPPGVMALLAQADGVAKNRFDRLQFVRQALYGHVVAAGGGRPIDVPPSRVDDMIAGGEATPYEISAAEVMLARWAGTPARLGFGFYGGELKGEVVSFRPRHGAAWLEAYFQGHGWIPIIGTPPRAKPSISNEDKKPDPNIVPTDELALSVYVPVERQSIRLLYELVRYYVVRVGPLLLLIALLTIGYPGIIKMVRASRRRRWANERGLVPRVVVAYAELRDRCYDLNIGDPRHSPLEFTDDIADDVEHEELAWLVTRGVWGDLRRDLREEDVEAAEEMARSVRRRVESEQTGLNRALAFSSRVSLKDPWTDEIPNLWRARPARVKRRLRFRIRVPRPRLPRSGVAGTALLAVILLLFTGCGARALAKAPSSYPKPLLPARVLDQYDIERRPEVEKQYARPGRNALVSGGEIFTLRSGETIQGSVQVSLFRRSVDASKVSVRKGIEGDLGSSGAFRTEHFGVVRLRVLRTGEQQVFVWFPADRNIMELFIMRRGFTDAEKVVRALVTFQRTAAPSTPGPPVGAPPPTLPGTHPTTTSGGSR